MKKCTIEGCGKPFIAKGMCHMHYRRELRKNPVNAKYVQNKGKKCSVESCNNDAKYTGFCGKHYQKNRKYGNPTAGKWYKLN